MLVDELSLKFGTSPDSKALTISKPKFTVFVGPNNSGKSLLLREIFSFLTSGSKNSKILSNIALNYFTLEQANKIVADCLAEPMKNEAIPAGKLPFIVGEKRSHLNRNNFVKNLTEPSKVHGLDHDVMFRNNYIQQMVVNLDGPTRLNILRDANVGDLKNPSGLLPKIFTNDTSRELLRKKIFEAVGLYFAIDMSKGGFLGVRFGDSPPPSERNVEDVTLDWMKNAEAVNNVSDGIKAFAGIMVQLNHGDYRVVTIDEPEAFLHPSLAYKLGNEIAKSSLNDDRQVFVATHSPSFLMGAIQSGADVNIVRLTHRNNASTARLLKNDDLKKLMEDPTLRSTNVLGALFHEHVIVTEADADRCFYQEINARIIDQDPNSGIPNALFLNSNGKDTLHRISKPIRAMGIPCATIADIDVLNKGGKNWSAHTEAANIPEVDRTAFQQRRKAIWDCFKKTKKNPKTKGGIALLSGDEAVSANNLINDLADYGFFVLDGGEIEHWLPSLNVSRSKHLWLKNIFAAMGSDPTSEGYLKPSDDDVWAFILKIRSWMVDSNRKGIPK